MRRLAVLTLLCACTTSLAFVLTACSTSNVGGQPGVSSDKIVVEELTHPVGDLSAYELVKRYHGNWLEKRGPMSFKSPVSIKVYVDNTGFPYGSASSLRQIRASEIESIEYFDGPEAQSTFGLGNVAGAILVHTKSGR